MRQLKKGDVVKIREDNPKSWRLFDDSAYGKTATIVGFREAIGHALELTDPSFEGHDCDGLVPSKRGQWAYDQDLEISKYQIIKDFYEAVTGR